MEELNHLVFLKINSIIGLNNLIDLLAKYSAEYIVFLFVLIEIFLYFYLKKKDISIFAFLTSIFGLCLNQFISLIYFHNRPFMDNLGKNIVNHLPENSFPSDHTTLMFSIAIYLYIKLENKILGEILIVLAFISGLSRIAVGVHYPIDIIGSIIIAILSSFIVFKLEDKLKIFNNFIFFLEKKVLKIITRKRSLV